MSQQPTDRSCHGRCIRNAPANPASPDAPAAEAPRRWTHKKHTGTSMTICECGCDRSTAKGSFLPGHDQKLRCRLEARVGGLLALRDVVTILERHAEGQTSPSQLGEGVKQIMGKAGDGI